MLVDLAVSFDPGVELALADGKPADEMRNWDIGFPAPGLDKVNDGVSCVMGDPDAG
jgi:hypothetical protein